MYEELIEMLIYREWDKCKSERSDRSINAENHYDEFIKKYGSESKNATINLDNELLDLVTEYEKSGFKDGFTAAIEVIKALFLKL